MRTWLPTLLWVTISLASLANAQSTAFTYQGRLNDNGTPANGVYDFTFQAFDAPVAGGSIGGTVDVNAVGVTNGLFTALVDLGGSPFTGPARWLQISVSTNGAGNFTTLVPRQALTPSPYAIYAPTAGTVTNGAIASAQLAANAVATGNIQDGAVTVGKIAAGQVVKSLNGLTDAVSLTPGANVTINPVGNSLQISAPAGGLNLPFSGSASSSGSIFTLTNSGTGPAAAFQGKVGVGTASPATLLHLRGVGPVAILQDTASAANQAGYVGFWNNASAETGWIGFGTPGSPHFSVLNARSGGNIALWAGNAERLTIASSGNIGIGATTPGAKLDVRGDIRLGASGEFLATSGEENLRIVRGIISSTGTILRGAGFTVARTFPSGSDGQFTITFTTPFASPPAVCFTADFVDFQPPRFAMTDDVNASSAAVRIFNASGVTLDTPFHFIAIGPR